MLNIASGLAEIEKIGPPEKTKILVYCFRGGKRSKLWADNLATIGYKVEVLPGGWKTYRHWVIGQLQDISKKLKINLLSGPSGCGKTRVLQKLHELGQQVIDLEGLALHRGSLIGGIPNQPQPSQKFFDSQLLDQLRRVDLNRPVWIEGESKKIGNVELPVALIDNMRSSTIYYLTAPMQERLRIWQEDFGHFELNPKSLMDRLEHLMPLVGKKTMAEWQALSEQGLVLNLFEQLMVVHYDPAYIRSAQTWYTKLSSAHHVDADKLDAEGISELCTKLMLVAEGTA